MPEYNILKWWNNSMPLNLYEYGLMDRCRNEDTYNNGDEVDYRLIENHYFTNMPCCNLNLEDWEITVDNCASNHIRKLFDYYVDDDTLVIISNAEHETTMDCFMKVGDNGMIIDHSKDIRGYNYDKIIDEAKRYKKVFFYCIGTQISTGEVSPQAFFVDLKNKFEELHIEYTMVLDAVQEMFLQPRDYSVFDYVIGTGHAICWNYDLGILVHKKDSPVKGFKDLKHLDEYNQILRVILQRKDKINIFTRCIHEYFYYLLSRPEFSVIDDAAPQLCSIRTKDVYFSEAMKDLLDKYEIRIEAFGQKVQFIRFRAQMFIKDNTLLIKGVNILNDWLKEQGYVE